MTHSEMPWILTRRGLKKDVGCNRIIEKEFIYKFTVIIRVKSPNDI